MQRLWGTVDILIGVHRGSKRNRSLGRKNVGNNILNSFSEFKNMVIQLTNQRSWLLHDNNRAN